jgi:hypothetical protein
MINFFNLSINSPTTIQLISLLLVLANSFIIFVLLQKNNKLNAFWVFLFAFFLGQLLFSFLWAMVFDNRINNLYELWQRIENLHKDSFIDIFFYNLIFLMIMSIKFNIINLFKQK